MNLHDHPADERLAALAGVDPDLRGDVALRDHVAGCSRCLAVTDELTRLRAALAELPDLAPPPHLRFRLPAVEELEPARAGAPFGARLVTLLRGALTPAMVAGAALALVGAVGTTGYLDSTGFAGGPAAAPAAEDAESLAAGEAGDGDATGAPRGADQEESEPRATVQLLSTPRDEAGEEVRPESGTAERGGAPGTGVPWLGILLAGVSIAVAAYLLRRALPRPTG